MQFLNSQNLVCTSNPCVDESVYLDCSCICASGLCWGGGEGICKIMPGYPACIWMLAPESGLNM